MKHTWSITGGYFIPDIATAQMRHGDTLVTELSNIELINALVSEHMTKSRIRKAMADYRHEDFGDEIRIDVFSGHRYRCLINLQYEGPA